MGLNDIDRQHNAAPPTRVRARHDADGCLLGRISRTIIGGVLADQIGYRPTFLVAGLLIFVSAIIVVTQVKENFVRPEPARAGESTGPSTRALLFGAAMMSMIGVMFALRIGNSAIQPIMPLYVKNWLHRVRSQHWQG